jgi:DNA-binding NarL/FixJ family response regulator
VREAERTRPDVVVLDIRLVDGSGIEATREIRDRLPDTKVSRLTTFADDHASYASIPAGAAGYVLKPITGGMTNNQIGAELFLAEKTVKTSVSISSASSRPPAAPKRRHTLFDTPRRPVATRN